MLDVVFVCIICLLLSIQELVLEKESRLRESMKMMGLKSSALFSAWFVKQFLFMMLGGLLFSVVLKVRMRASIIDMKQ